MTETNGKPVTIDDDSFDDFVGGNELAVIDFWAPWCGPCKRIAPIVEDLAEEYEGQVAFGKLNTDDNGRTAQRFGVMSIPTLMLFKEGSAVDQVVGVVPKQQLKERIEKHR